MAFVVAILGAESTGKTVLAQALAQALRAQGHSVALVLEYLREFCDRAGRTPRQDEQMSIAVEQHARITAATAAGHDIVIADTTALMIAVYSEIVFGDHSLYPSAQAAQRACDLTLLTALDLPWQADGWQRDGPQVREPVDARVRAALGRAGSAYAVVAGTGPQRLTAALAAVQHALARASHRTARAPLQADADAPAPVRAAAAWQWCCERCGDAACERRCLPRLPASA